MTITELIKELDEVRQFLGDLDVVDARTWKPVGVEVHQDVSGVTQGKRFTKVVAIAEARHDPRG